MAKITSTPTSTLEKAIHCLRVISVASANGMTGTEVAQAIDVPKATAHRLLKSLVEQNMLAFDSRSKRYRLGATTLNLGLSAMRQLDVPQIAHPYLERLARQTLETATLSMLQDNSRVYLEQIPSTQEVKMTVPVGMVFPLYAGASSKAILSTFANDDIEAYLDSLELAPLTESTIVDKKALLTEIEEIRVLGYAVSRGERQADASSIAAPVMGANGKVFGSISVSGPIFRFDRYGHRSIGLMVKENAEKLSAELGYHAPESTETPKNT